LPSSDRKKVSYILDADIRSWLIHFLEHRIGDRRIIRLIQKWLTAGRAKLKMIKAEMWKRMHHPIPDQGRWLRRVVQGYFNHYAVPTNAKALIAFRHHVSDLWRRTLRRRSQKEGITWARMTKLADAWLPKPTILHPWPSDRFAVTHPRWEPYAGKPPVRLCAREVRQSAHPYLDVQSDFRRSAGFVCFVRRD
jgi:hypothetical protein